MAKLTVRDLDVRGKRVFLRVDYNVPLEEKNGQMVITDETRIVATLPTLKLLMEKGMMHYDPPPPLTVTALEPMRRRGEFRFANVLRAWIDVEDGKIRDCRYAGGVIMGLTPITAGPMRVFLPTRDTALA